MFKEHASLVRIKTRGDQRTLRLAGRSGQTDSSRSFSWQACGYSEDVALNSCHSTECRATRSLSINAAQASKHKRDAHSIPGSSK